MHIEDSMKGFDIAERGLLRLRPENRSESDTPNTDIPCQEQLRGIVGVLLHVY